MLNADAERILITGGAGFIGSAMVRMLASEHQIMVLDKLTYAGHLENLPSPQEARTMEFAQGCISDEQLVRSLVTRFRPTKIMNLAAESHVDRSIAAPDAFMTTNVMGTYTLLKVAREYFEKLSQDDQKSFRFLQMSTDEVFGELGNDGSFTENSQYSPNSPYSASKASGDHLVRAWNKTYGLPTIITNCSNNYGPRQTPEKLIPVMIQNCLEEKALPIYGKGQNVRDWIHVDDHCRGVYIALQKGTVGESYCFGGNNELSNLKLVTSICEIMDELRPRARGKHGDLISFVTDRLGHDFRYSIDFSKSRRKLGFECELNFQQGLRSTIQWYLNNQDWVRIAKGKL